jgi:hypothetical protein
MERAGEYIRRAVEAEETAERSKDRDMRLQWLDIAAQWRSLARQRNRFGVTPSASAGGD